MQKKGPSSDCSEGSPSKLLLSMALSSPFITSCTGLLLWCLEAETHLPVSLPDLKEKTSGGWGEEHFTHGGRKPL